MISSSKPIYRYSEKQKMWVKVGLRVTSDNRRKAMQIESKVTLSGA